MSEVWLARRTGKRGSEQMVVKQILPHLASDPLFVQMFLNEARIAARFNQKNIARIFDFGEVSGSYFIAMEYIQGEDLGRVMRKAWNAGQWIAQPVAMRIMSECLEALSYAHAKADESGKALKVVHRDISPQNILISFGGEVKLVDFGIAKAADVVSTTQAGAIKGKFAYMSPEQAAGKPLDHRADIFSAGLVLYELLTGVRPLQRSSEVATHVAAMECKIEPPSSVSETPAELDSVVMEALAKSPMNRYPDADAFGRAIKKLCSRKGWDAGRPELGELMRILFADRAVEESAATAPDSPPDPVTDEETIGDDVRRVRKALRKSSGSMSDERERPPPPVEEAAEEPEPPDTAGDRPSTSGERDLYGEDDPLPPALDDHPSEDDAESTRAGPPRKIVVIDGPDVGVSRRFGGVRIVIGRTDNCTLVLSDKSVSRRHLELVQGERGVLLRDLGSGNGTKVNGERVDERLLHHEDVIEIGQTRMQFIDEAEAIKRLREAADQRDDERRRAELENPPPPPPQPAEDEPAEPPPAEPRADEEASFSQVAIEGAKKLVGGMDPRQKRALKVGGSILLGLFVIFMYLVFKPPRDLGPDQDKVRAVEKLKQAQKAMEDERYDIALTLIETAERISAGSDEDHLKQLVEANMAASDVIHSVEAMIGSGRFDEAQALLDKEVPLKAPQVSRKTRMAFEEVKAKLFQARNDALERQFEAAIAVGNLEEAERAFAALPPEWQAPNESKLTALRRLAPGGQKERPVSSAQEEAARAAAAKAFLDDKFQAVARKFQDKQFDRAVLECDRVEAEGSATGGLRKRAVEVKTLIAKFQEAFEDGERKWSAGSKAGALPSLQRAHELYAEIGFTGALGDTVDGMLVESLVLAAQSKMSDADLGAAGLLFRRAAKLKSPPNEEAEAGLKEVAQSGEMLYAQALNDRPTNPALAREKLTLLTEIAKGTPLARRAAAALQQIAKTPGR